MSTAKAKLKTRVTLKNILKPRPRKSGAKKNKHQESLNPRYHLKYKVCVSGAAETGLCSKDALKMAEEVGREIALAGMVLVTGATIGIPYYAAKGAKEAGGFVIGVSPAASEIAHVKSYRLPTDYHDIIIYTGFEYSGRNLLLTRSSDAIVTICGRVGTLNEFTVGFEDKKPMGVLEGSGGAADMIRDILSRAKRGFGKTVFAKTPKDLIRKLIPIIHSQDAVVHSPQNYDHDYLEDRDDT